jgi:Tol biopolymer transport system component
VTVYCNDGHTWFYYVTADGSKIELLLNEPIPLQDMGGASWSADGQYIIIDLGNNQTGNSDLYLIDLENTLQDPTTRLIQLTTDNALKYDAVWQPRP